MRTGGSIGLVARIRSQSRLRKAALLGAVAVPAAVLAVAIVSIVLGSWLLPVCIAGVAYFLVLLVVLLSWSARRERDERDAQAAVRQPEHSALLGDALPWLDPGADARLQRQRMLNWYATVGDDVLLVGALLAKSVAARDVIAHVATRGRLTYPDVREAVRLYGDPATRVAGKLMLGAMQLPTAIVLARVLYGQNLRPTDSADAIGILRWAADTYGLNRIPEPIRILFASYLVRAGSRGDAADVISSTSMPMARTALLTADALSPFFPDSLGANEAQWLAAFNVIFTQYGLEGLELARAARNRPAFERIRRSVGLPAGSISGGPTPLITVISSAYRPDESIVTALQSVVDQTWQAWELILVDDNSGDEYRELFERCAALDPRVKVISRAENFGTYANRNFALDLAKGELITIHDADDWMHPRRLELQARHLLANPAELGNVSYALRVSEELAFAQGRGYDMQVCEPSILFRRERAIKAVGYFDSVRAGADAEFRARLGVAQGAPVTVLTMFPPLTLQRDSAVSLSGGDFTPGWLHPSRLAYRSAWRQWHSECSALGIVPRIPKDSHARAFPAPHRTLGKARPSTSYDALFVLDFAHRESTTAFLDHVRSELITLSERGARVAVMHLWSVGHPLTREYRQAGSIQSLINSGVVDQVFLEDDISVRETIIRSADAVQFPPEGKSAAVSERVSIVAPRESTLIVNDECVSNAQALFGRTPQWITISDIGRLVNARDVISDAQP